MKSAEKVKMYNQITRDLYRGLNDEGRELLLWAENSGELYSQVCAIRKNLLRKVNSGAVFDTAQAQRAFAPFLVAAAKTYAHCFCSSGERYYQIFNAQTRRQVADYLFF